MGRATSRYGLGETPEKSSRAVSLRLRRSRRKRLSAMVAVNPLRNHLADPDLRVRANTATHLPEKEVHRPRRRSGRGTTASSMPANALSEPYMVDATAEDLDYLFPPIVFPGIQGSLFTSMGVLSIGPWEGIRTKPFPARGFAPLVDKTLNGAARLLFSGIGPRFKQTSLASPMTTTRNKGHLGLPLSLFLQEHLHSWSMGLWTGQVICSFWAPGLVQNT